MMKCDMCYDRTSVGKKPMCATVCPSEALYFGTREEIGRRRNEVPVNEFKFGAQTVRTKVNMMTHPDNGSGQIEFDILAFLPGSRPGAPDAALSAIWDGLEAEVEEEMLV
jgi:hypothetical protein